MIVNVYMYACTFKIGRIIRTWDRFYSCEEDARAEFAKVIDREYCKPFTILSVSQVACVLDKHGQQMTWER